MVGIGFRKLQIEVDLKIRGGQSPSESQKVRGFCDFREKRVFFGSLTARQKKVFELKFFGEKDMSEMTFGK